ncbi:MAG: hypothetical protein IBX55_22880 [Methyloprofundus sp.]|nr:hypothetical protein [Methyloprofundus sp.]
MSDYIKGEVLKVIDGDTFDMRVDYLGSENDHEYERTERIRIADKNAPELNAAAGKQAKS